MNSEQLFRELDRVQFSVSEKNAHISPRGRRNPRTCRFCLESEPKVAFKKEAHVVPQALGNRAHTSLEECDECNDRGSILENDLVTFLSLERAVARIRTSRRGSVKHKPVDSSYIKSGAGSNRVLVSIDPDDPAVQMEEVGPNELELRTQRGPFSLANVGKSLARMGWFLIPRDRLRDFDHIRHWIRGESSPNPPLIFFRGFLPGPGMVNTTLILCERLASDPLLAPLLVTLCFANSIFFFYLPDETLTVRRHIIPKDLRIEDVVFESLDCSEGRKPPSIQAIRIHFTERVEGGDSL